MSMCRVVYRSGGEVSIIHHMTRSRLTYEQAMTRAMRSPELSGCEYEDIDSSELPQDRTNRDAWRKQKGRPFTIDQNSVAARQREEKIHAEVRRMAEQSLIDRGEIDARA